MTCRIILGSFQVPITIVYNKHKSWKFCVIIKRQKYTVQLHRTNVMMAESKVQRFKFAN